MASSRRRIDRLDWGIVDDELHTWFNDQTRTLDASLYGRRLYDVMSPHWPTAASDPAASEPEREFARLWNAMPIFVFSHSLELGRPELPVGVG